MSLIALYYVCSVGIYYNVYRFKKRTPSQITSNFYVSNWKSSYDVDNEMVQNIARVK